MQAGPLADRSRPGVGLGIVSPEMLSGDVVFGKYRKTPLKARRLMIWVRLAFYVYQAYWRSEGSRELSAFPLKHLSLAERGRTRGKLLPGTIERSSDRVYP